MVTSLVVVSGMSIVIFIIKHTSPRVNGSQIVIRAQGCINLRADMSPTTTVLNTPISMIYFTTGEVMFTPGDSDVYMTILQVQPSGSLISLPGIITSQ